MALVLKPHRDPVAGERPQALAQRVIELALPLSGQELHDLIATGDEDVAIAPDRVKGVGARDVHRVARVPGVLGCLHLLRGGLGGEWRKRRALLRHGHDCSSLLTRPSSQTARGVTAGSVTVSRVPSQRVMTRRLPLAVAVAAGIAAGGCGTASTDGAAEAKIKQTVRAALIDLAAPDGHAFC